MKIQKVNGKISKNKIIFCEKSSKYMILYVVTKLINKIFMENEKHS